MLSSSKFVRPRRLGRYLFWKIPWRGGHPPPRGGVMTRSTTNRWLLGLWLPLTASLAHCASGESPESSSDGASGGAGASANASAGATQSYLVRADYHTKKTPPRRAGEFDLVTLSTLP